MGWAGVVTLVATAGYFLFRHPPRSWTTEHPSATPDPGPEARPTPTSEPLPARHDEGFSTPPPIEIEEESSPTTPKASASSAPLPVLAVPALNLESDTSDTRSAATKPPALQNMNGSTTPQPTDHNDQFSQTKSQPQFLTPRTLPQAQKPPTLSAPANTSSLMPPPSVPRLRATPQPNRAPPGLQPLRSNASSLMPPPSAAAGLRVPPSGGGGGLSNSTLKPSLKKNTRKVVLDPGYSPLDWAALAANPKSQLRGVGVPPGLLRVTPSMLKIQNGRKGRDAWTSYQGKVYNIQPYVPYHPGGKGELLRGAGKDSAQLFQEIHPWVNWDGILSECLIGILVSENDTQSENALDAMD
ncbi:Heme/steroid binding protein [Penicillium atrosanguineum]|nr:Heme/steroid binding protein [Penicillium atrosanguineum]